MSKHRFYSTLLAHSSAPSVPLVAVMIAVSLLLVGCGSNDDQPMPTLIPVTLDDAPPATQAAVAPTLPATFTPTLTTTYTETVTITPSMTITDTPTPTVTATPWPTPEPNALSLLAELQRNATPLPPELRPTVASAPNPTVQLQPTTAPVVDSPCQYPAPGGFGPALTNNPDLADQIGCPVGTPPAASSYQSAAQNFERGAMVWLNESGGVIYALYSDGTYQRFADTYDPTTDPERGSESPPAGLTEPVRGFGKVWRNNPEVRERLGWASGGESGGTANAQAFTRGQMLNLPQRGDIIALLYQGDLTSGNWRAIPGQF